MRVSNAFARQAKHVHTRKQTRSQAKANSLSHTRNAFTRLSKRVYTLGGTRSHARANACALYVASGRYCIYSMPAMLPRDKFYKQRQRLLCGLCCVFFELCVDESPTAKCIVDEQCKTTGKQCCSKQAQHHHMHTRLAVYALCQAQL